MSLFFLEWDEGFYNLVFDTVKKFNHGYLPSALEAGSNKKRQLFDAVNWILLYQEKRADDLYIGTLHYS